MKVYARVQDGIVQEIINPATNDDGDEVAITDRFTPELVAQMVEITDLSPQPECWWTYDGTTFAAPVPYQPTADEVKAANTATRDALLAQATAAIAPLQDAVDLDEATGADTANLKLWKQYRVAVNRIDLTLASPSWPTAPGA